MKKAFVIAAVLAALGGTALHFLYSSLPSPLTALISPVNESVREHLKLVYYPTLLAAYFLARRVPDKGRLWSAFLAAVLAMPLFMVGTYYLMTRVFGIESLVADITLYFVTMFGGFVLAWVLYKKERIERWGAWLLLPVLLLGAYLILFSFTS